MIYHIISDNSFFLQGANGILASTSDFRKIKIAMSNISINELEVIGNSFLKNRPEKIILNVNCIHKRRVLLRLAGTFNLPVLLMSDIHQDDSLYGNNITLISCLCTREKFLREILSESIYPEFKIYSPVSQLIIRRLAAGESIQSVSKRLSIDPRKVYAIKNYTIRCMGISSTKPQGMLLCRDILEMMNCQQCRERACSSVIKLAVPVQIPIRRQRLIMHY